MANSVALPCKYPSFKDLTFGVEYEFLAHIDATKMSKEEKEALDPASQPPRHVVHLISQAVGEDLKKCGLRDGVEITDMLLPGFGDKDDKAWIIKSDQSVTPNDPDGSPEKASSPISHFAGLEITTPVMPNNTRAFSEILEVSKALVRHPHVSFNDTCGLHVHVGNADEGFTLLTCQKLFVLLFLGGEAVLNTLFREDRHTNKHCVDIRTHTGVADNLDVKHYLTGTVPDEWYNACFPSGPPVDQDDQRERDIIKVIWKAASIDEFMDCLNAENLAYSWEHLASDAFNPTKTIEFRKAEGNLRKPMNAEFVYDWVQVCMGLVAFAVDADPEEFGKVIKETVTASRHSMSLLMVHRFLSNFGLDRDVLRRMVDRANVLED
ncbi:hypothetical protein SLS62_011035 [Diatrype stigma]|uniref:Uncharacterized protein n=1 Tax=Diatrype stigma TaxID=117547 RepID=A0AAN9U5X7_9PEZI